MARAAHRILAGIVAVAATTSPAFAGETVLAPATKWQVDWNDTSCTLSRAFGPQDDPLIIRFERFAPGNSFQFLLMGQVFRHTDHESRFSIAFGAGKPHIYDGKVLTGTVGETMPTIFIPVSRLVDRKDKNDEHNFSITPAMEAAVRSITLRLAGKSLRLDTGPMNKPFAALRKCTDNLVQTWGLDPQAQATGMRGPKPMTDPDTWLRSGDYPTAESVYGKQAIVNFRLMIDAQGKPTDCRIPRSYGGPRFDRQTCALLMDRARFEPALDARGQPMASYYINTVTWIMR
ncbi:energy transducer TonB [Novosphingobium album (ex Liu et al. 2023)]|uniref:Energy transducer TonB n=1 Tax=Novosphingobium album (ex Liu et al. 2023) TaxID=3031130 RepID=A0ABT5WRL6_9SPHN|nr:energy transducer TonB [Novosphingobium album (ex Liu et al. 2023)]MDE8651628.1 energy transducer TonB [Novosphingobium album (ex Liu et al. 2023)]